MQNTCQLQQTKAPGKTNGIFFQPKLTINAPGDEYEQEADAMADKVMRMSDDKAANRFFNPSPLNIQRKCQHCEEEESKMQRKESVAGVTQANDQTEDYINSLHGNGRLLAQSEKDFFQPRFGHDFSNVRVHNDDAANQSAKQVNALAYTHSNNIVFGSGQYQPGTESGQRLMAHELTHVVQQGGAAGHVQKQDPPAGGGDDDDDDAIPEIHPREHNIGPAEPDTGDQMFSLRWGPHGLHVCSSVPGAAQGSDDACLGLHNPFSQSPSHAGPCPPGVALNPMGGCCAPGQVVENAQCITPPLPPISFPLPLGGTSQPAPQQATPATPAQSGLTGSYPTGTIDNFNVNESGINPQQTSAYQRVLSSLRLTMQTCPLSLITITGYADMPGREADNMALSQRRADSVRMQLLIDLLSSATRPNIIASGQGTANPVDTTTGLSPRNRRVEVQTNLICPPLGSAMPFAPAFGSGSH